MHRATQLNEISFCGEVWTDARGRAIVSVPPDAYPAHAELEYALRAIKTDTTVRVVSLLREGRFSIATSEPHVKVAWRISTGRATTEGGAAS
jgi:hypothetical protein